jgi:uncharacterized membrane protein YidH (DUF202 family)
MMISKGTERFSALVKDGTLTDEGLLKARDAAMARGVELEDVLLHDYRIPRRKLLKALSGHFNLPYMEYDERIPVPPELLSGLDPEMISMSKWFPVMKQGDKVIVMANDPEDPDVREGIGKVFGGKECELRVALDEDIQWFIQDFLHDRPERLIGIERTGLAFWRNTMAQWRTRMACYRTDLAKARTALAVMRWGLGLFALANALVLIEGATLLRFLYWVMISGGISLAVFGLLIYLAVRKSRMSPPRHQTLVEVTAATVQFTERYHLEEAETKREIKETMLSRLGDFITNYCTILRPSPLSKERTHLARERNMLAAQRTLMGCYRTIYARARTGLAFIRTGVSFSMLGLGLMHYSSFSTIKVLNVLLILAGILMTADGLLWYLPARKEQEEILRVSF